MIKGSCDFMEESSSLYVAIPARFGSHRYCGSGTKMFLIYHITSYNHVFKGLCDGMG